MGANGRRAGWRVAIAGALALAGVGASAAERAGSPAVKPDPLAKLIRASGDVEAGGDRFHLDFLVDGEAGAVRVRRARDGAEQSFGVDEPANALLVFADQRLSFLWPALRDWAGPGLSALRAGALADTRARWQRGRTDQPHTISEASVRGQTRLLLQHSHRLWVLGYRDEANGLLRAALDANPRRTDWQRAEYSMVGTRLGTHLQSGGDPAAAAAVHAATEAALAGSGYAINSTVNGAAVAAESGRYGDALSLINRALAQFGGKIEGHGDKIPGSLREFAWIKACALHGLRRDAEAKPLLAILATDDSPGDRRLLLKPDANIRLRGLMCMHDAEGAVQELLRSIDAAPLAPAELVKLQPGWRRPDFDPATLARVRDDPRIRAALVDRMRVLPAEFLPALNGWAGSP